MMEAAQQTVTEATPAPVIAEAQTTTEQTPTPSPDEALKSDLTAIWEKNNPLRSEDGKFQADPRKQETETTVQPATENAEPEPPAIDVPNSWTAEQKAHWQTLPRATQEYIAQRESEMHKAITRAGEERKSFEPIQQTLEQFKDVLESNNLQPHDAIARMFAVERWLRTEPETAIKELAAAYKVDLSKVNGQSAATPENDLISSLRGEVQQIKTTLTAQQRAAQEAERNALAREIADFAKDHPHFEAVKPHMAGLLQSGAAPDLKAAYDMAIYANPEVRAKVAEEAKKAEQEKAAKEAAQAAKDAKKAAGINAKSSTVNGSVPRTLDDDLREQARKHYPNYRG